VTTSFVFDETVTFFNAHGHHSRAIKVGGNLRDSPSIQLIHVDERLFDAGWNLLQGHQDKRYSLTDCISFVVMKERGINRALTFNRHFAQGGFEVLPSA
jgi:predicted nucleic acid-binding protein